jgi:hypothetical protein
MTGYQVCYSYDKVWIEAHLCRRPDCEGGMTLDEACEMVAKHFEQQAKAVREKKHAMVLELGDGIC